MSAKPAKSLPRQAPAVRSHSIVAGLSLFGLIAQNGMITVPSDIAGMFQRFNSKSVDYTVAP